MAPSSSKSSARLHWEFSQVFADRLPETELQPEDVVHAIEFDRSGKYLALGDGAGRVIILESKYGKKGILEQHSRTELERLDVSPKQHLEYKFKIEFQSHEPQFDFLSSCEIKERINKIRFWPSTSSSLSLLSANDKTIKLWTVKDHGTKMVRSGKSHQLVQSESALLGEISLMGKHDSSAEPDLNYLEWANNVLEQQYNNIDDIEDAAHAKCRKAYANAHDFNINSISNNSDCETFVSADDLRINLWNIEHQNQCYNIVDMKPSNMEDLTEVITSATFHPTHCNLLAYSSSRGIIRLVDMRQSARCDSSARLFQGIQHGRIDLFKELAASISDMKFICDGRHILSRDYMSLKVWDTHMDSSPVAVYEVHNYLYPKLQELYHNDTIFDKFDCCVDGSGRQFATGSYSNLVRIFAHGEERFGSFRACKPTYRRQSLQAIRRTRRRSLDTYRWLAPEDPMNGAVNLFRDFSSGVLHLAWHPSEDLIACASNGSLLLFQASRISLSD